MAEVFRFRKKTPLNGEWTQSELAQFFRVGATLNRAGLAIETDSGVSDEGDPWFVFCRAVSDDVIVHFARCDNLYLIAAPGYPVVRGEDFVALIETLIGRYAPFIDIAKTDKKTIILHPSALLFALIVTCLFNSENSEAHSLSFATDEKSERAPDLLAHGAADGIGLPEDTLRDAGASHDRQLIVAFAAAIGSAVTFEQWQHATTPVDVLLEVSDDEMTQGSSPAKESDVSFVETASASEAEHNDSHATQTVAENSTSSIARIAPEPASHLQFAEAKPIGPSETSEINNNSPEPGREGSAAPSHSPVVHIPVAPAIVTSGDLITFDQAQQSTAEPAASHTEAYNDLQHVLGTLLTTHEVSDPGNSETRFILHLIEDQASGALSAASSVANASQNVSAAAGQTQETQSEADATATDKSASKSAPVANAADAGAASGSSKPASYADAVQVEKAVDQFIAHHPDFQLIDSIANEMILYDPHISAQNADQIEINSYHFADGSSVVLVGLGHDAAWA